MTAIIIIAVILLIILWFISVQRNLVNADELCRNSMSQIGVQQASRWDALTALVDLVKSYNEHEYNTLRDVISQRANITATSSAKDADAQEDILTGALSKIIAVAENYPELKANENYGKAMDSVNTYENQVRMSRMVYNDSVTRFNRLIRQIPSNIVAGMLGFTQKDYLQVSDAKTEMPSMKI